MSEMKEIIIININCSHQSYPYRMNKYVYHLASTGSVLGGSLVSSPLAKKLGSSMAKLQCGIKLCMKMCISESCKEKNEQAVEVKWAKSTRVRNLVLLLPPFCCSSSFHFHLQIAWAKPYKPNKNFIVAVYSLVRSGFLP